MQFQNLETLTDNLKVDSFWMNFKEARISSNYYVPWDIWQIVLIKFCRIFGHKDTAKSESIAMGSMATGVTPMMATNSVSEH